MAFGCSDKSGDTGDTGAAAPSLSVSWGSSSVDLTIGAGSDWYYFGIAETGTSADPWTGEDCTYGYTTSDGTNYNYCHLAAGGATNSYAYGGAFSALDAETETVFPGATSTDGVSYADVCSYLVYAANDPTQCWVSGHDANYFAGWGCDSF